MKMNPLNDCTNCLNRDICNVRGGQGQRCSNIQRGYVRGEWADGEKVEYAKEENPKTEPLSYEVIEAFVGHCATCEHAPNCGGCNHPYSWLMPSALKALENIRNAEKLEGEK